MEQPAYKSFFNNLSTYKEGFFIAFCYLVLACLWIVYSDFLAGKIVSEDSDYLTAVQTIKGIVFVSGTAVLIFFITNFFVAKWKKTEKEREEKARQMESILTHLPGVAYQCKNDEHWTMLFINEKIRELTAYSPEELINNKIVSYNQLIHPDDRRKIREEVKTALNQGNRFELTYRLQTKENNVIWVREHGGRIGEIKGQEYLEGYITDITRLKELGQTEMYYRILLNNANDAIYAIKVDESKQQFERFTEVNAEAYERLNLSYEELMAMNPLDLDILQQVPDQSEKIKKLFEKGNLTFETNFWNEKGQTRYAEVNAHLFQLDGESIVLAISRDITERVLAKHFLQEKNRELQLLLYRASHDLRSPITNVIGLINLARQEVNDPKASEYLDLLNESGEKLLYIVESLSAASSTKKGVIRSVPINIKEVLEKSKHNIAAIPAYQHTVFHQEIKVENCLYNDETLLETILSNLMSNAIEYRKNGENLHIWIEVEEQENGISLKISDNGQGMDNQIQPYVYDMFYRGHQRSKGSGLGLYIVKNAVEKMNGYITFTSTPGEGTTFWLYLPSLKEEVYVNN